LILFAKFGFDGSLQIALSAALVGVEKQTKDTLMDIDVTAAPIKLTNTQQYNLFNSLHNGNG
jgi:hypothetical protein